MQSVSMCSQYDPRLGKIIPCGGYVYELIIQRNDHWLKPEPIQVCDTHLPSFKEHRQLKNHEFTIIVEDKVIGVITPGSQERQRPPGKLES